MSLDRGDYEERDDLERQLLVDDFKAETRRPRTTAAKKNWARR